MSHVEDRARELRDALADANVASDWIERLARYGALLLDASARVNLTGAKSVAELLPHLLDSLSLVSDARDPHVDIGSGGGLPAVPLAIATGFSVTLIETTKKKAAFLREAVRELGLANATVVDARAEVAAHDPALRERFESGSARAVATAPTVAELLLPFIAPGGIALLQRGRIDARERQALDDAALVLGAHTESERLLDGERRLILVRKTAPTSQRFPRRTGIPEKRPLCS